METITTNNNWKKKFIIIWTGQLFSILSSSIAQFSMVLWIGMETGSAEVLSYAAIASDTFGTYGGCFCRSLESEMDDDRC